MHYFHFGILVGIMGLGLIGQGALGATDAQIEAQMAATPLVVSRDGVRIARFDILLARTPKEHRRGLKGYRTLPANMGMLFVMRPARRVRFWMRETYIPLDLIFITTTPAKNDGFRGRGDPHKTTGIIDKILTRHDVLSDATSGSDGAVIAVLELNAGMARAVGVRVGDRVSHSSLARRGGGDR